MAAAPPPTSTIRVGDGLRHPIVEGVLAPAERLRAEALAERFWTLHRIVLEVAGRPRPTAAVRAVSGIPRPFRAGFWAGETQRAQSLFCHGELVSALRAGRPELAEAVMRTHILGARDFVREVSHG
jgi:DNA-binding GntR family transcriptional regulator